MSNQNKQQREIAIFWDYENVPLPNWCSATQAAKAIVDAVSRYGRIVDRRLYYDFEKIRYRPRDCSSLDSSGFDLVNTPTRNKKETLDKKLIADVLTFAWDSAVRNDNKPCVVLLTGDGDYAYTLSKLRDRGIMTVVMVGRDCTVSSILVDTADVAMSLEDDVLRGVDAKINPTLSLSSKTKSSSRSATSKAGQDPAMLAFCRSVKKATVTAEDGWAASGTIALHFVQMTGQTMKDAPPDAIKDKAQAVQQKAESLGYIEIGRRKLDSSGHTKREIVASNNRKLKLSNEVFIRLLSKGEALLQGNKSPKHQQITSTPTSRADGTNKTSPHKHSQTILSPRLPQDRTDIRDLVKLIEGARIDPSNSAGASTSKAHVEFVDEKDAGVVLQAANKAAGGGGIYLSDGKYAGAVVNTRSNSLLSNGNNNLNYKSEEIRAPSPRTPEPTEQSENVASRVDPSEDSKILCRSIYLVASRGGHEQEALGSWVNSGATGTFFRSQLHPSSLEASSKEDMNNRFRDARRNAVEAGLVEMGRRDLSSNDQVYVAVALDSDPTETVGKLSRELYFHLLPPGQTVAIEAPSQIPESPRLLSKCIFMNNLPLSTTALQLAQYLETIECQAQRIQLKQSTFKGSTVIAAHVECVGIEDASGILRKHKSHGGLVYCGRSIYAVSDRLPPAQMDTSKGKEHSDMSYTREENAPAATAATDIDLSENSFHSDTSAPVQTIFTNKIMRQDHRLSYTERPL